METYTEDEFMKLTDNEKWIAYGELLEKYARTKWHPPFTPLALCKSVEHILGRKIDDRERLFTTNTWGWCSKNGFIWPMPRNDEKSEMDKYNVALWVSRKIIDGIK